MRRKVSFLSVGFARSIKGIAAIVIAATAVAGTGSVLGQTVLVSNPLGDAAVAAAKSGGIVRLGNSFTPSGSNFQITAVEGATNANPFGDGSNTAQVNQNFEVAGSTGVTYDPGTGHLTDFGLGLYQDSAHNSFSTGLHTTYNTLVFASSVTITVEDFDIKLSDGGFDFKKKVAPLITLLGAGNSVLFTFTPQQIFPVMVEQPLAGGKKGESDVWDINLGDLLNSLHLADGPISGFILSADMANNEKTDSDPYLLVEVSNGTQVPEPATALLLLVGAGMAALAGTKIRRRTS
jgi:hypothetical protein